MLDFICMAFAKLFGAGRELKIQNENICIQWDSNPRHATLGQVNLRFRPLGHDTLMINCGLMLQYSGIQINKIIQLQQVSNWLWLPVYLNWLSD